MTGLCVSVKVSAAPKIIYLWWSETFVITLHGCKINMCIRFQGSERHHARCKVRPLWTGSDLSIQDVPMYTTPRRGWPNVSYTRPRTAEDLVLILFENTTLKFLSFSDRDRKFSDLQTVQIDPHLKPSVLTLYWFVSKQVKLFGGSFLVERLKERFLWKVSTWYFGTFSS